MIVITLSVCTTSLKGDLTKWLFEVAPGVYVGDVSARVRERIWERIEKNIGDGRACMVYGIRSETHFAFRTAGETWQPREFDGLMLMKHPSKAKQKLTVKKDIVPSESNSAASVKSTPSAEHILPDDYVVLDLETTGLDPLQDRIIEVAMVKVKNNVVADRYSSYVQIDKAVPGFITDLTGITDETLHAEGRPLKVVLEETRSFLESGPMVCHNVEFDWSFLQASAERERIQFPNVKTIDTLKLARQKIIGIQNYRLNTLIDYLGLTPHPSHNGMDDCLAVHSLLCELKKIGHEKDDKSFI